MKKFYPAEYFISNVSSTITCFYLMLGEGTIPLAMLVAGSRMATLNVHYLLSSRQVLVVVLRLVVIPLTVLALLYILPFDDKSREILVIIAVMPVSIASVALSEVYCSDASFAAGSVLHIGGNRLVGTTVRERASRYIIFWKLP